MESKMNKLSPNDIIRNETDLLGDIMSSATDQQREMAGKIIDNYFVEDFQDPNNRVVFKTN